MAKLTTAVVPDCCWVFWRKAGSLLGVVACSGPDASFELAEHDLTQWVITPVHVKMHDICNIGGGRKQRCKGQIHRNS